MRNTQLARQSPFDSICQCTDGQEYWSARNLQTMLGYTEWRNFEKTIKKAMTACKNVGQNPAANFVESNKVTDQGKHGNYTVKDYRLTRFACYLTAMNGDPDKPEIAHAQTYFAVKAREAEIGSARSAPTYTISDALRQRAFANEDRVPADLFSTQLELARELHYWERLLNETLDNKSEIEKSVGRCFSDYARHVLCIPDSERGTYRHQLPNGRMVDPWAYPLRYLPAFRSFLREVYFLEKFEAYARYRAKRIGTAVPQISARSKKRTSERVALPEPLCAISATSQLPLFGE